MAWVGDRLTTVWQGHRLVRFLAVGGLNTAFGYGVYVFGLWLGLPFPVASAVALIMGIFFSFITQGRIVFGASLRGRLPKFILVWVIIYLVNVAAIWGLTRAGLSAYVSGFLAIPITALLSFVLQRQFVFQPERP